MIADTKPRFIHEWHQFLEETLIVQKQHQILKKIKKEAIYNPVFREGASGNAKIIDLQINKDDGTLSTYLEGEKYPVKSYPDIETVWFTAYYKRLLPLLANSLASMGWIKRIITLLALKFNLGIAKEWFNKISQMKPYLLKDEYWCKSVKEIRRVLKGKIDDSLIDAISLVIEYDSAYRYPLQDIITLLDKDLFKKNPNKEIKRLFDIFLLRNDGGIDKVKKIYKIFSIYLKLNRKLLKTIKEIVADLKIEEIKPSEEDYYWMLFYNAYNCFGRDYEDRIKEYNKLKNS